MVELNLDGCKCVCDSARVVEAVAKESTLLEIVFIVIVVIIIIIGLYISFTKLKSVDEDY